MMPGTTMQEISDAIVDAFDENSLGQSLRSLMNLRLNVITPPTAFGYRVFSLVEWADMNGRDVELVQAVAKSRPRHAGVQEIYKKYGMSIPVYVERGGSQVPASPTDASDSGLERIVKPHLSFTDFGIWRERMTEVEGRVCLITINGSPQGTGFLVGPDAVLTNYHVMEPLIGPNPTKRAADFTCLFDFKVLKDNAKTSTPVALNAADFLIDSSPYSRFEAAGTPDQGEPTSSELDFALIRLVEPIGTKPWAMSPSSEVGAPKRGWLRIPDEATTFESPMGILIAQHPTGWPLKLAVDTEAINKNDNHWLNGKGTRIRYATNTLGGSSGSPVFDLEWNLVALHHYGDPDWKNVPAKYNQGIPIHLIRAHVQAAHKDEFLGT